MQNGTRRSHTATQKLRIMDFAKFNTSHYAGRQLKTEYKQVHVVF